ncbi:MAG: hypothetical protein JOZ78_10370 [Chroococcidiopsidaceae cyanobacterium CP_BM_ER_R8_30]|nr:hypothetical protein [Chroococcidiopsidaceae cyanobacterium CP_BM_ER_R8_30]
MKTGITISASIAMLLWSTSGFATTFTNPTKSDLAIPKYKHIFIIIEENHAYNQIIGEAMAPNINRLAKTYGLATRYYGIVHPSQANYIALLGGSTFGIHDDDAYYCTAQSRDKYCSSSSEADYVDHTIPDFSLVDQLKAKGLTWKGYFESIPTAGSKDVFFPDSPTRTLPSQLYASKHNGFIAFKNVQNDPDLPLKLVGFDQLFKDLSRGSVPNYSHIVANQCNEMHGLHGQNVPNDCKFENELGRIHRGDATIGTIVKAIQSSNLWSSKDNNAIIITWDEDNNPLKKVGPQGCCGFDWQSRANFGGGHIPTIVITNHGVRGVVDNTPYNHYSLLRTALYRFQGSA